MKAWIRSDAIALALHNCAYCNGLGARSGRRGAVTLCNCVLRSIFRICYNRFRYCMESERHISKTTLELHGGGRCRRYTWSRKEEEYLADFYLVSKRSLSGVEWQVFRFHFLLGADWKLCCRRLGLDRGTFFHMVYRIEQKLGKVFRELEPYALYPLDEYFGTTVRREKPPAEPTKARPTVVPIRPPLAARSELPEKKSA